VEKADDVAAAVHLFAAAKIAGISWNIGSEGRTY
jgi:hypothetical protein